MARSRSRTVITREDLSDTCTLCSQRVAPPDIQRLDLAGNCRCPHCGGVYTKTNAICSTS